MVSEKGEFLLFLFLLLRSLGRAIYTSKDKVSKEKTAYKGITPNYSSSQTPKRSHNPVIVATPFPPNPQRTMHGSPACSCFPQHLFCDACNEAVGSKRPG